MISLSGGKIFSFAILSWVLLLLCSLGLDFQWGLESYEGDRDAMRHDEKSVEPRLANFSCVCVCVFSCVSSLYIYILRCSSLYLSAHFSSSSAAACWLWTFRKPLTFFSSHGKNHQSLLLWERKASTHFYTFTDIFRLPLGSTLFFIHHKKTFLLLFFLYVSNFLCFFPPFFVQSL
jgi:hypothetical protein